MDANRAKGIKFLKFLGIENIDDFDIEFISSIKSTVDEEFYTFTIKKLTPWNYYLLAEFIEKVGQITKFRCEFNFIYDFTFDVELLKSFISDFFAAKTYSSPEMFVSLDKNNILVTINFEDSNNLTLKDLEEELTSIFKYIGYQFSVSFSKLTINNENIDEEEELITEPVNPAIELTKEEEMELAKMGAIDSLKENYKIMLEERRTKELFKRGGYVEHKISEINENSGPVDFNGKVFELDLKDVKEGKKRLRVGVYDEHGAIYVTMISGKSLKLETFDLIKFGSNIRIIGRADFDKYRHETYVMCHNFYMLPEDELRDDDSVEKRVELHLHTNMSEMDGISSIDEYCRLASHMGHKAIAITDHGVVQAFPEAKNAAKKYGMKILYGCEFYMIDDYLSACVNPSKINLDTATYVVFDLESTGLSIKYDRITEFGAVKIKDGIEVDRMDILVNPGMTINDFIVEKTKITNEMVADKPYIKDVLPDILNFIGDSIIVSHNIEFDYNMLNQAMIDNGFGELTSPGIDTLTLSRYLFPDNNVHNLGAVCKRLNVEYDKESAHRADYDAKVLTLCWLSFLTTIENVKENGKQKFIYHEDLKELPISLEMLRHTRRCFHVTALAKNQRGLKDLYELVSISHVDYMGAHPFVKRSDLVSRRENLLLGSACFNGEVFYCAYRRNEKELINAISFYDYIEIQPLENYSWLVNMNEIPASEYVEKYLITIINLSKEQNKIIVATGDCHYCEPADKDIRDIYVESTGVKNTFHPLRHSGRSGPYFKNPDQHFRSTSDMLECFSWLGNDAAYEYVITNTNKIADICEEIMPIPEGLYPPVIENSEKLLRDLCYSTAHKMYGEKLPEVIEKRLEVELNGIISNGYSVIYYISHLLVKKTNDAGYIVGSRGSVGSSFVATMAGITEVNPLTPHYLCPNCQYLEFVDDPDITSGFDLPNKKCPHCGHDLIGDGQSIPFETFLGFNAEKVPDIDLNFPTDFQSEAHKFTKELLGEDHVLRAGTISTVQSKTAIGYIKKYYELLGIDPNTVSNPWIYSLAKRCENVKRTTGQHPGGIIVIPQGYTACDFTPVQYPAGDIDAEWKTTHFDFHSIHDTVLKFDMLGHVDPQALKMMCSLTNIDYKKIPMNDKKVLSIFSSNKVLNLKHKYIKEDNGAIGIPEFGTQFVRQILRETHPTSFRDLIIISGISHGTDVWTNNAQKLINEKTADLRGVIGCRDDIMTYLISVGLNSSDAFKIMELVRKGRKVPETLKEEMRAHGVPEYYIDSCDKIKYLFPKGHACAYVTMAVRVGYFKVYYPLEFYATFFTLRCDAYDPKTMIGGIDVIYNKLKEFEEKKNNPRKYGEFKKKDEDVEKTLTAALEFAERGFIFENVSIEKSDSNNFIVDYENKALIMPFKVVDGMAEASSGDIIKARNEKEFTSKEDLQTRGKLSSANMKALEELGVLDKYQETDQILLFDLFDL